MCVRKDRSSKWITKHKRWLLYALHEFTCAYCGKSLVDLSDPFLTLDHIVPIELGGSHKADNLVTACRACNSAKEKRSLRCFLSYLDAQGVDTQVIRKRIKSQRRFGMRVETRMYKQINKEHTQAIRKLACLFANVSEP
jgi:hypothetical protein